MDERNDNKKFLELLRKEPIEEAKNDWDRKTIIDLLMCGLIFILIVNIIISLFIFDKDSFQCLENPVRYHETTTNHHNVVRNVGQIFDV